MPKDTHAFDVNAIAGQQVTVTEADGEEDGEAYALSEVPGSSDGYVLSEVPECSETYALSEIPEGSAFGKVSNRHRVWTSANQRRAAPTNGCNESRNSNTKAGPCHHDSSNNNSNISAELGQNGDDTDDDEVTADPCRHRNGLAINNNYNNNNVNGDPVQNGHSQSASNLNQERERPYSGQRLERNRRRFVGGRRLREADHPAVGEGAGGSSSIDAESKESRHQNPQQQQQQQKSHRLTVKTPRRRVRTSKSCTKECDILGSDHDSTRRLNRSVAQDNKGGGSSFQSAFPDEEDEDDFVYEIFSDGWSFSEDDPEDDHEIIIRRRPSRLQDDLGALVSPHDSQLGLALTLSSRGTTITRGDSYHNPVISVDRSYDSSDDNEARGGRSFSTATNTPPTPAAINDRQPLTSTPRAVGGRVAQAPPHPDIDGVSDVVPSQFEDDSLDEDGLRLNQTESISIYLNNSQGASSETSKEMNRTGTESSLRVPTAMAMMNFQSMLQVEGDMSVDSLDTIGPPLSSTCYAREEEGQTRQDTALTSVSSLDKLASSATTADNKYRRSGSNSSSSSSNSSSIVTSEVDVNENGMSYNYSNCQDASLSGQSAAGNAEDEEAINVITLSSCHEKTSPYERRDHNDVYLDGTLVDGTSPEFRDGFEESAAGKEKEEEEEEVEETEGGETRREGEKERRPTVGVCAGVEETEGGETRREGEKERRPTVGVCAGVEGQKCDTSIHDSTATTLSCEDGAVVEVCTSVPSPTSVEEDQQPEQQQQTQQDYDIQQAHAQYTPSKVVSFKSDDSRPSQATSICVDLTHLVTSPEGEMDVEEDYCDFGEEERVVEGGEAMFGRMMASNEHELPDAYEAPDTEYMGAETSCLVQTESPQPHKSPSTTNEKQSATINGPGTNDDTLETLFVGDSCDQRQAIGDGLFEEDGEIGQSAELKEDFPPETSQYQLKELGASAIDFNDDLDASSLNNVAIMCTTSLVTGGAVSKALQQKGPDPSEGHDVDPKSCQDTLEGELVGAEGGAALFARRELAKDAEISMASMRRTPEFLSFLLNMKESKSKAKIKRAKRISHTRQTPAAAKSVPEPEPEPEPDSDDKDEKEDSDNNNEEESHEQSPPGEPPGPRFPRGVDSTHTPKPTTFVPPSFPRGGARPKERTVQTKKKKSVVKAKPPRKPTVSRRKGVARTWSVEDLDAASDHSLALTSSDECTTTYRGSKMRSISQETLRSYSTTAKQMLRTLSKRLGEQEKRHPFGESKFSSAKGIDESKFHSYPNESNLQEVVGDSAAQPTLAEKNFDTMIKYLEPKLGWRKAPYDTHDDNCYGHAGVSLPLAAIVPREPRSGTPSAISRTRARIRIPKVRNHAPSILDERRLELLRLSKEEAKSGATLVELGMWNFSAPQRHERDKLKIERMKEAESRPATGGDAIPQTMTNKSYNAVAPVLIFDDYDHKGGLTYGMDTSEVRMTYLDLLQTHFSKQSQLSKHNNGVGGSVKESSEASLSRSHSLVNASSTSMLDQKLRNKHRSRECQSATPKSSMSKPKAKKGATEQTQVHKKKVDFTFEVPLAKSPTLPKEVDEEDYWSSTFNTMLLRAEKAKKEIQAKEDDHRFPRSTSAHVVHPVRQKGAVFLSHLLEQDKQEQKSKGGKSRRRKDETTASRSLKHGSGSKARKKSMSGNPALHYTYSSDIPNEIPLHKLPDINSGQSMISSSASSSGVLKIQMTASRAAQKRAFVTHQRMMGILGNKPGSATPSATSIDSQTNIAPTRYQRILDFSNHTIREARDRCFGIMQGEDSCEFPRYHKSCMVQRVQSLPKLQPDINRWRSHTLPLEREKRPLNYHLDHYSDVFRYYNSATRKSRRDACVDMFSNSNTNASSASPCDSDNDFDLMIAAMSQCDHFIEIRDTNPRKQWSLMNDDAENGEGKTETYASLRQKFDSKKHIRRSAFPGFRFGARQERDAMDVSYDTLGYHRPIGNGRTAQQQTDPFSMCKESDHPSFRKTECSSIGILSKQIKQEINEINETNIAHHSNGGNFIQQKRAQQKLASQEGRGGGLSKKEDERTPSTMPGISLSCGVYPDEGLPHIKGNAVNLETRQLVQHKRNVSITPRSSKEFCPKSRRPGSGKFPASNDWMLANDQMASEQAGHALETPPLPNSEMQTLREPQSPLTSSRSDYHHTSSVRPISAEQSIICEGVAGDLRAFQAGSTDSTGVTPRVARIYVPSCPTGYATPIEERTLAEDELSESLGGLFIRHFNSVESLAETQHSPHDTSSVSDSLLDRFPADPKTSKSFDFVTGIVFHKPDASDGLHECKSLMQMTRNRVENKPGEEEGGESSDMNESDTFNRGSDGQETDEDISNLSSVLSKVELWIGPTPSAKTRSFQRKDFLRMFRGSDFVSVSSFNQDQILRNLQEVMQKSSYLPALHVQSTIPATVNGRMIRLNLCANTTEDAEKLMVVSKSKKCIKASMVFYGLRGRSSDAMLSLHSACCIPIGLYSLEDSEFLPKGPDVPNSRPSTGTDKVKVARLVPHAVTDLEWAMTGSDLCFFVGPAFSHESQASKYLSRLTKSLGSNVQEYLHKVLEGLEPSDGSQETANLAFAKEGTLVTAAGLDVVKIQKVSKDSGACAAELAVPLLCQFIGDSDTFSGPPSQDGIHLCQQGGGDSRIVYSLHSQQGINTNRNAGQAKNSCWFSGGNETVMMVLPQREVKLYEPEVNAMDMFSLSEDREQQGKDDQLAYQFPDMEEKISKFMVRMRNDKVKSQGRAPRVFVPRNKTQDNKRQAKSSGSAYNSHPVSTNDHSHKKVKDACVPSEWTSHKLMKYAGLNPFTPPRLSVPSARTQVPRQGKGNKSRKMTTKTKGSLPYKSVGKEPNSSQCTLNVVRKSVSASSISSGSSSGNQKGQEPDWRFLNKRRLKSGGKHHKKEKPVALRRLTESPSVTAARLERIREKERREREQEALEEKLQIEYIKKVQSSCRDYAEDCPPFQSIIGDGPSLNQQGPKKPSLMIGSRTTDTKSSLRKLDQTKPSQRLNKPGSLKKPNLEAGLTHHAASALKLSQSERRRRM